MDGETVETVTAWESEPFTGGYAGLHDLAAREFTGAVTDGTAWLFVLNGRVVGTADGDVDSFAGADGTAYAAPDPSLPLLFAMREAGGETRGRYYTDDTPLSEVDATLSSGNFTGYVDLSENVLSGDYYVVYYGGRSLACAFVGASRRTITGDEAFDRANDEVGIYEVREVDVSVADVPDPSESADPSGTAGAVEAGGDATRDEGESGAAADPTGETADAAAGVPGTADPVAGDDAPAADDASVEGITGDPGDDENAGFDAVGALTPDDREEDAAIEATDADGVDDTDAADGGRTDAADDRLSAEAAWRGTRRIPALDPDETGSANGAVAPADPDPDPDATADPERPAAETDADGERAAGGTADPAALDRARAARDEAREELAAVRADLAASESAVERAREENASLRGRVEELEADLAAAREEVETLREEAAAARERAPDEPVDRSMPADRALAGTNLFVRYDSKTGPTLADAEGGAAVREEVNANLGLDRHTDFEAEGVAVDGRPFDEFLADTVEYRFVEWAIRDLLYEIRETRNESSMRNLFVALPKVDRAELRGTVELTDAEGERVGERSFDVVLRDRMGAPLVVADVTASREPTTGAALDELVEGASEVVERGADLGAAFHVTTSFFEPGALEAAADATGGGLVSWGKRKSVVRISRKRGFHLCLVEGRGDDFHLAVPEL